MFQLCQCWNKITILQGLAHPPSKVLSYTQIRFHSESSHMLLEFHSRLQFVERAWCTKCRRNGVADLRSRSVDLLLSCELGTDSGNVILDIDHSYPRSYPASAIVSSAKPNNILNRNQALYQSMVGPRRMFRDPLPISNELYHKSPSLDLRFLQEASSNVRHF